MLVGINTREHKRLLHYCMEVVADRGEDDSEVEMIVEKTRELFEAYDSYYKLINRLDEQIQTYQELYRELRGEVVGLKKKKRKTALLRKTE